jgi:hypothetical protein
MNNSFDITYIIFGFLDFLSKIKFRCVSKYMHKLEIYDFNNIPLKYIQLLNDEILLNYPFIKYLNASTNSKITNVNHMDKLIELNASGYRCGINNKGIQKVNLIKLNASDNPKITNVNHMNKLIELNANGYCCGINNEGIQKLNLINLNTSNNPKITNVNQST